MSKLKLLFTALAASVLQLGLLSITFASTPTDYSIINNTPYVLTVQVGVMNDQLGNFYCYEGQKGYENFFTIQSGGSCTIGFTTENFWNNQADGVIQLWYGYYPECDIYYTNIQDGEQENYLTYSYLNNGDNCLPPSRDNVTLTNGGEGNIVVAINSNKKAKTS